MTRSDTKVVSKKKEDETDLLKLVSDNLKKEIDELTRTKDNLEAQAIDARVRLEQTNKSRQTDERKDNDVIKQGIEKLKAGLQEREFECDRRERAVAEREKTHNTNEVRLGVIDVKLSEANKRISDSIKIEKKAKIMMDEATISFSDAKALEDTEHVLAQQNKELQKKLEKQSEEWMTKIGQLEAKEKELDLQMTKFEVNKKNKELVNA